MGNFVNVLFINSTSISLFEKKNFLELSIGGTNAAGVMEENGCTLDMYDVNFMLNEFRDEEKLTSDELKSLTDKEEIVNILDNKSELPPRIKFWVRSIAQDLPNPNDYDNVCVSLNRWMYKYYPSIASFSFILYVLKELNTNVRIYVGGEYSFEMMESHGSLEYFQEHIDYITYCRGRNISAFLDEIKNIAHKPIISLGQVDSPQTEFKVNCEHEFENDVKDIFTQDLLNQYPQLKSIKHINIAPFKFIEGCIFKCSFCPSGLDSYFDKTEVNKTVDRLEMMYDEGITDFKFFNDNINFKLKYVIEMCNEIVKRNMKIRFSDSANLRVGSEEMYKALGEAGCVKLWYGTETISPRILKEVNKMVSIEQIYNMLKWSDEAQIWNSCNFIFNFPNETQEEFDSLVEFIDDSLKTGRIDTYALNTFKLLLGTEYEKYPERFDIELIELDEINKMYKYNELNGLPWAEREAFGIKCWEYIEDRFKFHNKFITQNDALLFGLRKAGYDKQTVRKAMQYMTDTFSKKQIDSLNPAISDIGYYDNLFFNLKG